MNKIDYAKLSLEREQVKKILAQKSHLRFIKYCWQKPAEPFLIGIHTMEICRLIDEAIENYKQGKSTHLLIKVPFRHGKSDIVSRYLPPHFLGEFPDSEVMIVTYASSLAEKFSRFARGLIRAKKYKELYEDIEVKRDVSGVKHWGIEGRLGTCSASGLSSGLTGSGYHLGILDDFCASRLDAESDVIRSGMWESFTNDFLTRGAPVSITIILATPWHIDDIIGRIKNRMDKNHEDYDPEFPQFKTVSFPAMNTKVEIWDRKQKKYISYYYDFLFKEHIVNENIKTEGRFDTEWYIRQKASLGEYGTASLLQCNPQNRGKSSIDISKIKVHNSPEDFPKVKYTRVWDLAHTAQQRIKDDPDYTSGTLLAFTKENGIYQLWIKNVVRFRENPTQRNNLIRAITDKDGQGVPIAIENSIDSKDAIDTFYEILRGKRIVKKIQTKGDKVARFGFLEPIFEAGNVHILRGEWNADWFKELKEFPFGPHDDQVDNLSAGYTLYTISKKVKTSSLSGL